MVYRLESGKRAMILNLLCEGSSLRSISRVLKVHRSTIARLLTDAGSVCRAYHNEVVRELTPRVIQVDELWALLYCHQNRLPLARSAPPEAGDVWTWTALDSTSKVLISWHCGGRELEDALPFLTDLRSRLAPEHRCEIHSDGHYAYLTAVDTVFGNEIAYGRLRKLIRSERQPGGGWKRVAYAERDQPIKGRPEPEQKVSTSYVERQNLNIRMHMRRYTRKTNAHSKSFARHCAAVALFGVFYNFCRLHLTLGTTPAVAAGLAPEPYPIEWLCGLVEATYPPPTPRGPDKRPRQRRS